MALDNIEKTLERYFEGATSLVEEQELKKYFTSADVAPHLQQYQSLFVYFSESKKQTSEVAFSIPRKKRKQMTWISLTASVVVVLGIGFYIFTTNTMATQSQNLGTFDDPEVAFKETQKALAMLSSHVNKGIDTFQYIETYETTRDNIFLIQ